MDDNTIKHLLQDALKNPENEQFNQGIIEQLQTKPKKRTQLVFNERSILNWFLVIAGFVLFFYLIQGAKIDANAILIGSLLSAMPLYLLIFNKIYSFKK